jgi:hypothetical protein
VPLTFPATAYAAAMIGEATLVPPKIYQAPLYVTHTPVDGSATAETSATVRREQPLSACQVGLEEKALQPLPAPLHTVSVALRVPVFPDCCKLVPPTAVTYGEEAGYSTPYPASPELAVMATPGRLKTASKLDWPLNSVEPQLLLIAIAPRLTATLIAAERSLKLDELASTRRMLQYGQMALAI